MAVAVGIPVHNYKTVFTFIQDEVFFVFLLLRKGTEDTTVLTRIDFTDILHSPRSPEPVQLFPP